MNRTITYLIFVLLVAAGIHLASAQEDLPVPDPAADADLYGGPLENLRDNIVERIEKRITERQQADEQAMEGLLDRLRRRDDTTAQEFASIREWFKQREDHETQRYHGLRGLLEQIRDRPPADNNAWFPRIAELRADIQAVKESQELGTGPIREGLKMLTSLVYGLILLAVVLLGVDIYRTFFRRA
jgi:hypothetical protein